MSAAAFKARYAAYTVDLVLLAPIVVGLAWRPLGAAHAAWLGLEGAMQLALDRAFGAGHIALFDLATALRGDAEFMAAMTQGTEALVAALLAAALLAWGAVALYFVGFEASPWRATPGKRALGLRVAALDGAPAGIARVLLRFAAAGPSWLLLHLGHALVMFRDDDRAGHDLVAGTRVDGGGAALPAWAVAWLGLQALAVAALLGWVVWTVVQAVLVLGL
ncbi:MAG: RDD family protein [Silanimonas sp.]